MVFIAWKRRPGSATHRTGDVVAVSLAGRARANLAEPGLAFLHLLQVFTERRAGDRGPVHAGALLHLEIEHHADADGAVHLAGTVECVRHHSHSVTCEYGTRI